ncbi:MAG TPA: ATP-binding cassette domain-containing protein [Burkholderiaceae bacterium]|nr:ATP-binding cassette domain-containing protein [Burkholderiaceae bacterium]
MLEIDDITVQREGFRLRVGQLSLSPAGRVTLIGPSGCGKSTLIRALMGLEPRARVRGLRWQSQDISDVPPHRRPFGWLPQELGLWPHLSALAHVAFARTRGTSARPSDADAELLAHLGLLPRAHAFPAQLSGGERQRLAFARVIALRPTWALLDEPFSHLDPVLAAELSQSFQALAEQRQMGLIQVTHQLQRPSPDDLFWVLEAGALVQDGRWAELKDKPRTPWIARFVDLHR